VTEKIEYLTADQEENHYIAQANNPIDDKGRFPGRQDHRALSR
jgi:DNA-directed RNA polymerase subunit beta